MAAPAHEEVYTKFKILLKLFQKYKWLTDAYMRDLFTRSHYEKLPPSWISILSDISVEELGAFLDWHNTLPNSYVWPLSLLALRRIIQATCLPRDRGSRPYSCLEYKIVEATPKQSACFHHHRLKNLFLKHVKPKKRYEIEKMTLETARLASALGVKWVIDIGSGLGHLCRTLAYGYNLKVIGVENQAQLTARAERLDKELEVTAGKHLTAKEIEDIRQYRPHHKEKTIDFNSTPEIFMQMIVESSGGEDDDFGIVGLHPCGDLAAILLKIFITCPRAKFINVVGCCYHKMTFAGLGTENIGFPLSRAVAQEDSEMSMEAAALGCHAIEAYSARLRTGDYEYLKIHCFRAALERIILARWPQHAQSGLNNVRHYPDLTFSEYCEKALKRLGLTVSQEDLSSPQTLADLAKWKNAVFFHSLWLMLGPAIETVILLDRLLYLIENGIPCQLQAAFDPTVSPRNYILSAMKLRRR